MSFLAIGIIWSQDCTRQNLTLFEITGIQTAKTDKNHVKDINRGATLGTFNKKHSKPLTKQDSSWSRDEDGVGLHKSVVLAGKCPLRLECCFQSLES
jgi:hypothetical protein